MAPKKSRTRRTRVVPNRRNGHRPSSCTAGRRPSHFFKIILPSTTDDKKLRIPVKFVMEFGDELSDVVTLTVPNGHFWQVGLEKGNKEIWFDDGWQDFMESHSIHYGYFLVFRYERNSKFHVLVFDNTATEIHYPWREDCELEDEVDKLKENEMSNSDKLFPKHEVDGGTYVREIFSGTSSKGRLMMSRGRDRAIEAARLLKPTSPSFMAFVRPYHISRRGYLYVPYEFAGKYLSGHQFVKLQTCDGKQWRAWCCVHGGKSKSTKTIGWCQFCGDNDLAEGDVCVFELIKRKPVVLKVSIFHLADYEVN
ncbi:B3 domain-containing transcription factor VRN1-like [Corylus avellana]|uniref:B3 domain-containing transcription factor VRN1-like n=1 Tax=Corylus avellana TaxID=13451 RepID=UPI00286B2CC2|nr:B3 domain-containing transcription factor VRN1-like [Corylus avellana]